MMALGIGANTAVFSVVNGVLLKPLPYQGADRIVTLRTAFLIAGGTQPMVSIANFRDWRDQSSLFEAMATYRGGECAGHARDRGRVRPVGQCGCAVLPGVRGRAADRAARSLLRKPCPTTSSARR